MSMTPEELAALTAAITESLKPVMAEMANTAATSHTKRLEQKLAASAPPPAPEAPKAPAFSPEVDAKIKVSPELAAIQATLLEVKANYEREKELRVKAEDKAKNDSAFQILKSSLTGVKPELQDAAAKLLFHVEKRVSFDDNGNALFRMQRDAGGGIMEDVDLPLSSGVEHWTKSKEAAAFLPAPGGTPGVGRGGTSPTLGSIPKGRSANGLPLYDSPATNDNERVARATESAAAIAKLLGNS